MQTSGELIVLSMPCCLPFRAEVACCRLAEVAGLREEADHPDVLRLVDLRPVAVVGGHRRPGLFLPGLDVEA